MQLFYIILTAIFVFSLNVQALEYCEGYFYQRDWLTQTLTGLATDFGIEAVEGNCEYMQKKGMLNPDISCEYAMDLLQKEASCEGSPIVCFTKEFAELYSKENLQSTKSFLSRLAAEANYAGVDGKTFNMWSYTLKYFKGDKEKALKYLGVLLSGKYELILNSTNPHMKGIEELRSTYRMIKRAVDRKNGMIELYPPGVASKYKKNGTVYHFYSNAYLAHKLNKSDPEYGKLVLLLGNARESIGAGEYDVVLNGIPERLDVKKHANMMRDLYYTYAGVMHANDKQPMGYGQFIVKAQVNYQGLLSEALK